MQTEQSILDVKQRYLYISEYEVDLVYGGPEEGGWWVDWMTFVEVNCVFPATDEDAAQHYCRLLNEAQRQRDEEEGKTPRWSVIGTPDTTFVLESFPGEEQTTHRPHYE